MTTEEKPVIEITFDWSRGGWRLLLRLGDRFAVADLDALTGEAFEWSLGVCQVALAGNARAEGEQA